MCGFNCCIFGQQHWPWVWVEISTPRQRTERTSFLINKETQWWISKQDWKFSLKVKAKLKMEREQRSQKSRLGDRQKEEAVEESIWLKVKKASLQQHRVLAIPSLWYLVCDWDLSAPKGITLSLPRCPLQRCRGQLGREKTTWSQKETGSEIVAPGGELTVRW